MSRPNDRTLYRGSAPYYARGRLPYAPAMPEVLADAIGLDGTGRLLDVGCGPGIVALVLRERFEEVIGIDADAGMVDAAIEEARRRAIANSRFVRMLAEDLPARLGRFRTAVFAQSFHWMDRSRVAGAVAGMLRAGGSLVYMRAFTRTGIIDPTASTPHPQPPWEAIDDLIARYAPSPTLSRQRRPDVEFLHEEGVLGDWFEGPGVLDVPDGRVLSRGEDEVVAAVYSASSSAPHVFGDRIHEFETELRELLRASSPSGEFSQLTGDTQLRIWRVRS
jgi:SAM-dependent methyltransferase